MTEFICSVIFISARSKIKQRHGQFRYSSSPQLLYGFGLYVGHGMSNLKIKPRAFLL